MKTLAYDASPRRPTIYYVQYVIPEEFKLRLENTLKGCCPTAL